MVTHSHIKSMAGHKARKEKKMQVVTFTIKNAFGQKERREARVVRSTRELPVGLGKIGEINGHLIFSERSLEKIEYAKLIYAIRK